MSRPILRALPVLAAMALAAASCAHHTSPAHSAPSAPVPMQSGIYLSFVPAPPRALDLTRIVAQVRDKESKPIAGANVSADLTMPTMTMPPNSAALLPTKTGEYAGQGRFAMPGDWAVTVTVKSNGRQITQTFPVTVR